MHASSGRSGGPRRPNKEDGFTLIEVMISILLAMIAVIGIVGMYRVEARASSNSRHVTEASVLAGDRLEQLRTTSSPTTSTDTNINELGVTTGIFTRVATVTPNVAGGYIDLQVVVTWTEEGNAKTVTLYGRRGP